MGEKIYRVTELSRIAGVTVRTLHHYHDIGLLIPSGRSDAGYREYSSDDLVRLHEILVGRELGMSLSQIQRMLDDPEYDRRAALVEQRTLLVARARRTETMLRSIDNALRALEGEPIMEPRDIFDGFDPADHEEEARARWGNTDAYAESARRTERYTADDWRRIKAESNAVLASMAEHMAGGATPGDEPCMALAEQYRLHIDRWFYPCSHTAHASLADLYTADPRFAANLNKFGDGLAAFLADAIRANLARAQGDSEQGSA